MNKNKNCCKNCEGLVYQIQVQKKFQFDEMKLFSKNIFLKLKLNRIIK